MIATLGEAPLASHYAEFLEALAACGFEGEIAPDYANRTVLATDNSIYQRLPQAAVYPKHAEDLERLTRLAAQTTHRGIVLTPRGGGTGTNGQSLTDGIVVDVSRHMNRILEIDVENRRVRVQAGVIKDQLNAALKPHGLFFAPELSTSNRATIGGMISTDASGQGSCEYGKTRNHVLALDTVLIGGQHLHSRALTPDEEQTERQQEGILGRVHTTAAEIIDQQRELIEAKFPPLNRCLTGYDLAHLRDDEGQLNLNSLLCGSEGSLGFLNEAVLNVLPIPKHSTLINVRYTCFMDALRDAKTLKAASARPTSIETVDDTVLQLAMEDFVWDSVAEFFPATGTAPIRGINLIEFNDDDESALAARVRSFTEHLSQDTSVERLGYTLAEGRGQIQKVYAMRKRSVGLLGNVQGEKRPVPFVEDTAVPPEHLADFIAEFRAALDARGLSYGMFGHVDAGVLHVRPAIDMKDSEQEKLIRAVSDEVATLTQKYGGLLWGEHGKGVRSEYAPRFFGELYPSLQRVKAAFDAFNQLNPGKIASSAESGELIAKESDPDLLTVDGVPMRGQFDRTIDERAWQSYDAAVYCNGNGACYNYDLDDPMCPSWKATRDRRHSPKGRASLIREWLRLQTQAGIDVVEESRKKKAEGSWGFIKRFPLRVANTLSRKQHHDYSHEVYDAMAGCLACKSCAGQCPIKVNVPQFRSQFLEVYHGRYLRPLRYYVIGGTEFMLPTLAKAAPLYNAVIGQRWVEQLMRRTFGMSDSPALSRASVKKQLNAWGVAEATPFSLALLTEQQRANSVILVQDAFTTHFEAKLVMDVVELLSRLNLRVLVMPYSANGKPLQVQGFLGAFERTAAKQAERLRTLARFDIPLVGIDPAMTLIYRQEYVKTLGEDAVPEVLMLQEWLATRINTLAPSQLKLTDPGFKLLSHCTEKTNAPGSPKAWQQVFAAFGLELELVATGCCGMSGTYGHETRNAATSKTIYAQSWQPQVEAEENAGKLLATGYSCRSQVKRYSAQTLHHPLQALLAQLKSVSLNPTTDTKSNKMTQEDLLSTNDVRDRFSKAMSAMYQAEVPQYGTLLELVETVNQETLDRQPELHRRLETQGELARLSVERHGAIRVGTAAELSMLRRLFAVMGMYPVGYYDLSEAGVPVHSTAFRPIDDDALAMNPFRVFTSLLRLELIESEALRQRSEEILAKRDIFTPGARELIERHETQGGLTSEEADQFVKEALETFRWHQDATVDLDTYHALHDEHRLIADVVCFCGPHINHLTPRTLDIDEVQRRMPEMGMNPKTVIEGPPRRECPILLRQTSFKALEESIRFAGNAQGTHTARFGEIEQRGMALTPKGRELYDQLLNEGRQQTAGLDNDAHQRVMKDVFAKFPDNDETMRREGLAYFHYHLTAAGQATKESAGHDIEALIEQVLVEAQPITYEDFLPVSAAGIFQSNLGGGQNEAYAGNANRDAFEEALGAQVTDELSLYAERENASKTKVMAALKGEALV